MDGVILLCFFVAWLVSTLVVCAVMEMIIQKFAHKGKKSVKQRGK